MTALWKAPRLILQDFQELAHYHEHEAVPREYSESHISTVGGVDIDVGTWQNDHNIVHVIHTQFLPNRQHEYPHLASAAADMLTTLTMSSIKDQTNKQFLWIIWSNPELSGSVAKSVAQKLKSVPNAVLLRAQGRSDRDFRSLNGVSFYDMPDELYAGDRKLLMDYYTAAQSRLLVETRLDVGDSLARNFVESVQSHAARTVAISNNPRGLEIFCPQQHLEWHFDSDIDHAQDDAENGAPSSIHPLIAKEPAQGYLLQFQNPRLCINSGLSVAYNSKASARQLAPMQKASVMDAFEECPSPDELAPIEQKCTQRGKQVLKYDFHDIRKSDSCPAGSFLCKGDNGEKRFFGGPRFDPQAKGSFVECRLENEAHDSVLVSVKVQKTLAKGGGQTELKLSVDDREKFMMAAVYMKGGPGGNMYRWYDQGKVGATLSGIFETPNNEPLGHVDLCLIPTQQVCPHHNKNNTTSTGLFSTSVLSAKNNEKPNECRRKLQMVFDEETLHDKWRPDNSIRNAVFLSHTPADVTMKDLIPTRARRERHTVAVDAFPSMQDKAWNVVETDFGIPMEHMLSVRLRLAENMERILSDAYNGPCYGHAACGARSTYKASLQRMLDKVKAQKQ